MGSNLSPSGGEEADVWKIFSTNSDLKSLFEGFYVQGGEKQRHDTYKNLCRRTVERLKNKKRKH